MNFLKNPQQIVIFLLGFSSGIPIALIGGTLQAWMVDIHTDLTLIGIFSLVGIPYSFKFLWAPFMDRFTLPFLGRRKGWILLTQICLFFSLIGMAFSHPQKSPVCLAFFALFVAFSSASQDIVIDAYKTELLEPKEFGLGAATSTAGYRLAMLFSGAFALILSETFSWPVIYVLMAGSISIGMLTIFFAPEPSLKNPPPKTLKEAIVEPFMHFFRRKNAFEVIAFLFFYKLDVVIAVALMTPFIMSLGFTKSEIGAVTKGFGLFASIIGSFLGGVWLRSISMKRALWLFGVLQGISGFCFYFLAKYGHNYPLMITSIAAENFFSGMGNAAYSAFLMSLCHPKFTATQFALFTSIMALTRILASACTGWLAVTLGWETYFLLSIACMTPSLLLLFRFSAWQQPSFEGALY